MKKRIMLLVGLIFISNSCSDLDDNLQTRLVPANLEVEDFVWRGMNFVYLYKDDVPDLADDRFATDEEYTEFLESFDGPEDLFQNLLFLPGVEDPFSIITDDRFELEQSLQGTGLTSGVEFGLFRFPDGSDNVFGIVRFIFPNSDAANSSLIRGDIFTTVDGVQLTSSNLGDLLFNDNTSVTYGLATFDGSVVTDTDEEITVAREVITEDPIFIANTLNVDGQNIGYLMYNGFRADFDEQLNDAFGEFAANGISDLVLDLRYNGGGSVITAVTLGSMITGQFEGEVFSTEQWNSDLQAFFEDNDPDRLVNPFRTDTRNGSSLNRLNLNRVFVLTTGNSASASELVINSLSPYIDVIQIGEQTRGKFQASITVFDSQDSDGRSDFDDFDRDGINPNHDYAMQPQVLIQVNANGVSEFSQGLSPNLEFSEDITNYGVLGDPSEPFLARALQEITGGTTSSSISTFNTSSRLEEIYYKKTEMIKDNFSLDLNIFREN